MCISFMPEYFEAISCNIYPYTTSHVGTSGASNPPPSQAQVWPKSLPPSPSAMTNGHTCSPNYFIQTRAHIVLVVVLYSRVVARRTGPQGETLEKSYPMLKSPWFAKKSFIKKFHKQLKTLFSFKRCGPLAMSTKKFPKIPRCSRIG